MGVGHACSIAFADFIRRVCISFPNSIRNSPDLLRRRADGLQFRDMSLKDYRAKRNFKSTPEPQGDDETARSRVGSKTRFFCVQKHLATALHYDFRLEHNGVLLSWAVPKGPSLDPAVKRLAMHVEDHPLEYGEFEGVIPEGYGAGVVMLWDRGTWEPEQEDVDASLAKGDLKFRLDGYKLKGSWVLVRTKGWGGGGRGASRESGGEGAPGRSWLLIKHRDDWAGPIDITTFAPKSVKSGGTFRDILTQEAPDLWHSNRPAAGKTGDAGLAKIVEKVIALDEEEATQQARDAEALEHVAAKEKGEAASNATAARKTTAKKTAARKETASKAKKPAAARAKRSATE
jgi:bifunctional non-homologous end joining protein LigD